MEGVASNGVHLGNWLTARQAQALLNARRDAAQTRAAGPGHSEVAALMQQRDGRWCIVDLI